MTVSEDDPPTELTVARAEVAGAGGPQPVQHRILAFIDEHEDALLRSCRPGHLTGSAMLVDAPAERCVLLLHAKLGRWLQPGGHADGEGDLAEVALREAAEETGLAGLTVDRPALDLDIHRVDPPEDAPHDHLDVRYLVRAPAGSEPTSNHESHEVRWVPFAELGEYDPDEGLVRLAAAARARLGR